MAKKRGGLAGLYDRNKGVIKALAPIALGAIPGVGVPLAAVAGAAMGADREGKGYFKGLASREGLAGAALGGVSGYAGGKMGKSAASSIKNMLTAQKMKSASALIDQANANIASQGVPGVDMPSFASRDVFAGNLPIGGYSGDAQTYLADVASRGPSAPMQLGRAPSASVRSSVGRMASRPSAAMPSPAPSVSAMAPSTGSISGMAGSAPAGPFGRGAGFPTPGAASIMAPPPPPAVPISSGALGGMPSPSPVGIGGFYGIGGPLDTPVGDVAKKTVGDVAKKTPGRLERFFNVARENKDLIGAGVKGIQMALPEQPDQAALMNAETARRRLAMEQDEMDEARRIREARSEMTRRLLAPYIEQYSPALRGYLNG
jgi:hypothetical protein